MKLNQPMVHGLLFLAFACTTVAAETINLDINSNILGDFGATYAPTAGNFANETFNGLNVDIGTASTYSWMNLVDAEGDAAPGVSFSVDLSGATAPNWSDDYEVSRTSSPNCANCNALQRDRLYSLSTSSPKFGIAGLDPTKLYSISLFASSMDSAGNLSYTQHYDLFDTDGVTILETKSIAIPGGATGSDYCNDTFVEGFNFVTFQVSGNSSYTFQSRSISGVGSSYPMLSGARIMQIPEPGTIGLLVLGGMTLMGLSRRRRRTN